MTILAETFQMGYHTLRSASYTSVSSLVRSFYELCLILISKNLYIKEKILSVIPSHSNIGLQTLNVVLNCNSKLKKRGYVEKRDKKVCRRPLIVTQSHQSIG